MGAVARSDNVKVRNKQKNSVTKQKFSKQVGSHNSNYPPSLLSHPFPPFSPPAAMRPRPPFPMGRMPPPGMGPMPPPGVRLLPPPPGACPPPPPLFRNRVPPPPPGRMGPRGPLPPMPPMRVRPPLMGPPPLMRPPPPMMGPRRFPPRLPPPPPPMLPPNKMRQLKHKMHAKKNNKKKNQAQPQVDLSSSWVTNDIKREFETKDKLFATAKESNKLEDWDKFKEQRSKCDKMYKTAKLDYVGMHPEEVFDEQYSDEEMSEYGCEDHNDYDESKQQTSGNFCDACERGFANAGQLKLHMQQHRICGIDGCKFVAHEKIVEKHINMQHVTGLYYRIAKTNTPEDIAKWIEERKKKYPTKENIEKRQKQQQEMMKRGERIQIPKDRFGKNQKKDVQPHNLKRLDKNDKCTSKSKLDHHKVPFKRKKPSIKPEVPKTSLLDDRSTWNGNLPPFQGTSELYEEENGGEQSIIDDSEWLEPEVSKCETNNSVIKTDNSKHDTNNSLIVSEVPRIETNALGALMGAYGSSDESDIETVEPESKSIESLTKPIEKTETDAGDELPDEQKILKHDNNEPKLGKCENIPATTTKKQQNSRCRNRKRKRQFSKEETVNPKETVNNTGEQRMVRRRVTLLERLLASEIKHERNVILQCVRHVVQNNFFEKTEHSTENSNEISCSSRTTDEEHAKDICDNDQRKETYDTADTNIEIKSDD